MSFPAGAYDFWRGETSLIRPVKGVLDVALREFCADFEASSSSKRSKMRRALSRDESFTLLTFSQRAAVFALRERDTKWITGGLSAIAAVDVGGPDDRDILSALALLHHAAIRLAADVNELFRDAAALSRPEVAGFILRFIAEPPVYKDMRSSWHSEEVQTEEGVGIIDWGWKDYNPTSDLKALAVRLADLVASDRYQPDRVAVASELPFAEKALGVAAISALLRPIEDPRHHAYQLEVFLAEVENEQTARSLRDRVAQAKPTDFTVMTAFAEGRLLCLFVARCRVQSLRSIESREALARFEEGVSRILSGRTVLT